MEENKKFRRPRVPSWFAIVGAASFITVLVWPWMIASSDALDNPGDTTNLLLLTFPVYAVVSIYLAYRTIDDRPYVAVILILLLWLSFGAMWLL